MRSRNQCEDGEAEVADREETEESEEDSVVEGKSGRRKQRIHKSNSNIIRP